MPRRSESGPSPAVAPRLPRFSPARISLYLFCPRAYFFYYHRKLRWGSLTAGHAFGGHLHRALQSLHARGGAPQVPLEELLGDLRDRWSTAGFASEAEAAEHLAAGQLLLERYYQASVAAGETLWTEKMVQHRYPDYVLFGKVDRLDRRPDGSLEVIDYKSGRLSVTEAEVRDSLAMQVYQLVVARQHPGVPVHATILCLRTGVYASVLREPDELDAVEAELDALVRRIMRDERLPALPGDPCRECVYPRVCPPGRAWLQTHPDPRSAG